MDMETFKQATWWMCFLLFWGHQFFERALDWHWVWADSYLDSLLCMPILLGLVLFERRFLLKQASSSFPFLDTAVMVILLGLLYEEVFTSVFSGFTKDYWDYLCYFIGGLYFYFFVNTNLIKNTVNKK
jgi:hypothetical protein